MTGKKKRGLPMIVALSRFTIANEMAQAVRTAFQQRPHQVDHAPRSRARHRGHDYHAAHEKTPKRLKLLPGSAELPVFEVFAL